ncbi:chemotaxis protein CheR [Candidatus Magnetoovum chiemensis]|nr:chemotaxis protein CheR [Candidatus Magnetoovum chiemensis]
MDDDFGFRETMDIIFCRNVVIYFDRPTQEKLLNKFSKYLQSNGYLFMGHSETLSGLNVPFVQVAPTIYKLAR